MSDPRIPDEAADRAPSVEEHAEIPAGFDGGGDPACWEGLLEDDEHGVFGDHGY